MKRNNLVTIILTSVLLLGCGQEAAVDSKTTVSSSNSENSTNVATENSAVRSGSFVTAKKTTTGVASIISENGQNYLELDNFSTGNGPDVKVILHRDKVVPANVKEENYINLAPLESFSGKQRYLIPGNVDLDEFNSVGIWCKQFNVTFGYAAL